MDAVDLPMFPLGSVLFPGQLLPLHIFEPRYQEMLQHCLAGGHEFGVVLIERGHEVGGGDVRSTVGTVAKILQAAEVQPGHWAVVSAGSRRIRIERWEPDDPWPHAMVADLPDEPAPTGGTGTAADGGALAARWSALCGRFRRVAALAAELSDEPFPVGGNIDDDPGSGSFQIAAMSPLGSFDRQKVLASRCVDTRIGLLEAMLTETEEVLQATLHLGGQVDPDT